MLNNKIIFKNAIYILNKIKNKVYVKKIQKYLNKKYKLIKSLNFHL
jgi:hypothetical protein